MKRPTSRDYIKKRLAALRKKLRAERISWGELHELQYLAQYKAGLKKKRRSNPRRRKSKSKRRTRKNSRRRYYSRRKK